MANPYLTSVADVKADLGITVSTYDTRLLSYVKKVTSMIETLCNRANPPAYTGSNCAFIQRAFTEKFTGFNGPSITLTYAPVSASSTFTITDQNGNTVPASSYAVDYGTGIVRFKSNFTEDFFWSQPYGIPGDRAPRPSFGGGYLQLTVAYTGGFKPTDYDPLVDVTFATDTPVVPHDLQFAAMIGVKKMWDWTRVANTAVQSETLGQYSYQNGGGGGISGAQAKELNDTLRELVRDYVRRGHIGGNIP